MNRAQRRSKTGQNRASISKSDILEGAYNKAYKKAIKDVSNYMRKLCYASICYSTDKLYHFDSDKMVELIGEVDDKMEEIMSSDEAINDVYERYGVFLDFDNVGCPIEKRASD